MGSISSNALKYTLQISEGSIAMVHGCFYDIAEICVPSLNLILNETGIHYCIDVTGRIAGAKNVNSLNIDSDTMGLLSKIKLSFEEIKKSEETIFKNLNLEKRP